MVFIEHMEQNKNNTDSFNKQDLKHMLQIIGLGLLIVSLLTTLRVYYVHNSPNVILDQIKGGDFIQIASNIDEKKLKEFNDKDSSPFKQIFDSKISFFTKTNGLGIFIEYNIFNNQCELTSRVMGVWSYLDKLNKNNMPLSMNIKTYKIKDDVCNSLYGYNKF
jgi:hypothetical protein